MRRVKQKRPGDQRFPIIFPSVPVQTLRAAAKTYFAFRDAVIILNRITNAFLVQREHDAVTPTQVAGYCFFSGSTFGSLFPAGSSPWNALTNAFRNALNTVVSISGFGGSNVPANGTFVPNRSFG